MSLEQPKEQPKLPEDQEQKKLEEETQKREEKKREARDFVCSGASLLLDYKLTEADRLSDLKLKMAEENPEKLDEVEEELEELRQEIKSWRAVEVFWQKFMDEVVNWKPEEQMHSVNQPKEMLKKYTQGDPGKLIFLLECIAQVGSLAEENLIAGHDKSWDKETALNCLTLLTKSLASFQDKELVAGGERIAMEVGQKIEEVIKSLRASWLNVDVWKPSDKPENPSDPDSP